MDHKQNTHGFIRQSYDMVQSGEDYLATLIGVLKSLVSTIEY